MSRKHYDNRNDLLAELKRRKERAEYAIDSAFSAYMMVACLVLHEDFELDQENIEAFTNCFREKLDRYHNGELSVGKLEQILLEDVGVWVEPPRIER